MAYKNITGTGVYNPEYRLNNPDICDIINQYRPDRPSSEDEIKARSGILERRIAGKNETIEYMGFKAAEEAIANAGIDKRAITCIRVATNTNLQIFPTTAARIQDMLGLNKAKGNKTDVEAADIPAGCSGTAFGIQDLCAKIDAGHETVLLVAVEKLSDVTDYSYRDTAILFGDQAGAMVIQKSDNEGIIQTKCYTDGSMANVLCTKPREESPSIQENKLVIPQNPSENLIKFFGHIGRKIEEPVPPRFLYMENRAVFTFAARILPEIIFDVLAGTGYTIRDVNSIVPHQANYRIIDNAIGRVSQKAEMPPEEMIKKFIITIDYFANTSSASYLYAFHYGLTTGKIKQGDLAVLAGFGAGLTYGAILARIARINPFAQKEMYNDSIKQSA